VLERFGAYGWDTQRVDDGNDVGAISTAIHRAHEDGRPSLIAVRTHIGYGSPHKQDTQKAHGSALGEDEVRLTKEAYGWDPDRHFYIPDEALDVFRRAIPEGEALVEAWDAELRRYAGDHPDLAAELQRRLAGRQVSQATINALAGALPGLFGGAADLSESNLTDIKGGGDFSTDEPGRNLRFGVREHAMGGITNGIAYHGGFHPYCATFLTFSDYMRGSVRLAALAGLPVTYVWTHDSVGLGE